MGARGVTVAIYPRDFDDCDVAKFYAYARQIERRNLTREQLNAFIARAVLATDRPNGHGGDRKRADFKAPIAALIGAASEPSTTSKSAVETAEKLGISPRTIERTRAMLASEDEDTKMQLLAGNGAAVPLAHDGVGDSGRLLPTRITNCWWWASRARPRVLPTFRAICLDGTPPPKACYRQWQVDGYDGTRGRRRPATAGGLSHGTDHF